MRAIPGRALQLTAQFPWGQVCGGGNAGRAQLGGKLEPKVRRGRVRTNDDGHERSSSQW